MNGRSLGLLAVAVLCGLGAMYGTNRLISKKGEVVVEMQDVVTAARDLKVEEVIKAPLLKVVRMPKTSVPPGAFASLKDLEDRWVTIGILEGEPVVDRKLAARGSPPGLVARIPVGMRAFAVEVNEQTGVSGFILPDHRVDVVQMEPSGNGQLEAETVLQDVQVLASGQVFTRPDDRSIQARTVTLAVTPEQVDTLVSAKSRGALTLALRGLNDHAYSKSRRRKDKEEKDEKAAAVAAEPKPAAVVAAAPPPPPPPPPPAAEPAPAPTPAAGPPPARFVVVYRGLDNMRRIRVDLPADLNGDDAAAPETARAAAVVRQD